MTGCDFSFRGETLSSRGYIIGNIDSSGGASTVTTDSQRNFSQMSMFGGKRFPFLYAVYSDAIKIDFSIFKEVDGEVQSITPQEAASMKKWLSSPIDQEFRLIDDLFTGYRWYGSFNVEEIHAGGICIGLKLSFISTAPFAYKNMVTITGSVLVGESVTINDTSDEEGYIYPEISVTLQSSGELRITNSYDERTAIVKNCVSGETITFTPLLQVLSSSSSHMVGNDFNYSFVRISNSYSDQENILTFNLPCTYSISYSPIAKVVFS